MFIATFYTERNRENIINLSVILNLDTQILFRFQTPLKENENKRMSGDTSPWQQLGRTCLSQLFMMPCLFMTAGLEIERKNKRCHSYFGHLLNSIIEATKSDDGRWSKTFHVTFILNIYVTILGHLVSTDKRRKKQLCFWTLECAKFSKS